MGTRGDVSILLANGIVLVLYNHYDSYIRNGLGEHLLEMDISRDKEALAEFAAWCKEHKEDDDFYEAAEVKHSADLWPVLGHYSDYFSGVDTEPDYGNAYSYYYNGHKWFVYDWNFHCWRPLARVNKRGYINYVNKIEEFCFSGDDFYPENRFETEEDYFAERPEIKAFHKKQHDVYHSS